MALTLDLSYSEQNDNKKITLTDTAGTYTAVDNPTGWGSPNIAVTDIVTSTDTTTANKYHLLLTLTLEDSSGTSTTYDTINLYDLAGPFTTAADLVFPITMADLKVSGVAAGTSSDEITDGVYSVVYTIVDNDDHSKTGGVATTSNYIVSEDVLFYGVIKVKVYDKLRQIPTSYSCKDCDENTTIKEADLYASYLSAIKASSYIAKKEELISMLSTLENMISYKSNITW